MESNLKGRLRNTNLPKSNALLPLFEAVVNSIHSIDERIEKQKDLDMSIAFIHIHFVRSSQTSFDKRKSELIGFKIEDNGIGFNEENFNSFKKLDSDYKISKGCRGIGRLLWLKEFQSIEINSIYKEKNLLFLRSFRFNAEHEVYGESKSQTNGKLKTSVSLSGINKDYLTNIPKSNDIIARALLEHCLWYFLREGSVPCIQLIDSDETINLNDVYDEYMLDAAKSETLTIKNQDFEVTHIKVKLVSDNTVSYSAANRLVKSEPLNGKIPALFGRLKEHDSEFNYMCFVSSSYLTDNVTPERLSFNISENIGPLFTSNEITFGEIKNAVYQCIESFLEPYLCEQKELGKKRFTDFINKEAPRYRPIIDNIPEKDKIVDPQISNKDLELKLHNQLMVFESTLIKEGHELMIPQNMEDEDSYKKRIEDYLSKASDLRKSDLANYVAHRKVIIDLLANALKVKSNGKYVKEDLIHNLIMPMGKTSNELFENDSNLWIIDERLAFHNFLASDKTIKSMPITEGNDTKEPDLLALNVYDNPLLVNNGDSLPLASLTVIEFKRPMRNDAKAGEEKDPIEQALKYIERIRNGKVLTETGRPIPQSDSIPAFCYVISDLTESIVERCKILGLRVTADKLGYFGYNDNYKAYIEVLSFDQLLKMSRERNRAFFDKLGLPIN